MWPKDLGSERLYFTRAQQIPKLFRAAGIDVLEEQGHREC
ncbi:hypothetical protein PF003_g29824 [Phytophthora fragariae]|nr:hypothetical protein PF003_g29824 [Phytophthora fragariae]